MSRGRRVLDRMARLARASMVAAVWGVSSPVGATPPDAIDVIDTLFGLSAEHLFVMRTAIDNMGLHAGRDATSVLVAVELATGTETVWPVYRGASRPDYEATDDVSAPWLAVGLPDDGVNPYAVLATFGGETILPGFDWDTTGLFPSDMPGPTVVLDTHHVAVMFEGEARNAAPTTNVIAAMSASLRDLAQLVVRDPVRACAATAADLLSGRDLHTEVCTASEPVALVSLQWDWPVQTVRITCLSDAQVTSLIVVLPRVP